MDYVQILCGLVVVLSSLYYYFTSTFDYWKKRDIRGPKPTVVVGNFGELLLKKKAVSDNVKEWYDEYKTEPMFGLFAGRKPVLVINDLDLIRDVLIRDFSLFVNRGIRIFPKIERLSQHLFTLEAERWRPIRAKLSPIFTSGKLKEMFPLMLECSENLEKSLDQIAKSDEPLECKELAAKFTTDVIGSCVFGINMNALSNEESEFRRMGRQVFAFSYRTLIRDLMRELSPSLYEIFGRALQQAEVEQFFINVITDTMKYRRENNIVRPDFINMLMELQNHPEKMDNIEMTDALLTSQAFVFFVAGFETSSSTIAHALYELAQNQDIQAKLREEVREMYDKHNGTLTYDQVKEMTYLDKVIRETLRKYPVLAMLTREAMQDYTLKDTKLTIPKGTLVWIPVSGIQRDPNLFPDPDTFDPERFNADASIGRHPMSYLPFGDGPRNCIGARFANYQTKLGLISVIRNHKVDVCEKTVIPYKSDPNAFVTTMKEAYLKVTRIRS